MKVLMPFLKLFRRQWLMMFFGLMLTFFTLLAGTSLLSLSGWFLSATAIAGLAIVTAEAFNFFTPAGGVRFFSIMRTASRYGERVVTHEATFRLLTELRVWLWQKLMPLSAKNLQGLRQGDLFNRLVTDIDTLDHLYLRLLTPILASLMMICALYFGLSWFDPFLAGGLCFGLLVAWFFIPVIFYNLGKQPGIDLVFAKRDYRVHLLEFIQGQAELSLFNAQARYQQSLSDFEQELYQAQLRMNQITAMSQAAVILASGGVLIIMLTQASFGVGTTFSDKFGQPPGALYALMVFAALSTVEMLMPLAGAFQHLSSCFIAATRLTEVTEQTSEISYPAHNAQPLLSGALTLQGVSFGYHAQQTILEDISFTIQAGEKVALLGKTGSGKSTLVGLITRQWLAQSGEITLDQQPLAQLSEAQLRQNVAVISQRVHLFSGSLRENLLIGAVPDEQGVRPSIPDQRLIELLEQVGLQALLQGEQPLDAWLGQGGRQLSGGELRRIEIARVLLGNSKLLLLDEPTEGLDKQTEQEVLALLHRVAGEKTWLMISHRPSTLKQLDSIYLIENGRLQRQAAVTE